MFGKYKRTHRLSISTLGMRRVTASGLTLLLACGALGLLLGSALPVSSQNRTTAKMKAPPLQDLIQLIDAARRAGLTEDQVRQLTLQDEEGNSINAWQYYQEQTARKAKEEAQEHELQSRVYLTVPDIFSELRKGEPADLANLRDRLPTLK